MEIFLLILVLIVVIGLAGVIFVLFKKLSDITDKNSSNEKVIQMFSDMVNNKISDIDSKMENRLGNVQNYMSQRLSESTLMMQNSTTEVNSRLTNASKVIGDLQAKISAFEEGSKRIYDVGKDITELQNIFKAQKLRGGFGELLLESMLEQFLPKESFVLQYAYKSRDIVDAIIRLKDGYFLAIDSKFSLENFRKLNDVDDEKLKEPFKRELAKDMKKHVDAIATKYISKEEGSLDIALMYIPAENIYYETVIRDDAILNIRDYALSKNVIPVSPNTLLAYLQIILLGMKGMQVSKKAREILDTIKTMESEFANVLENYAVVGKHLSNAQSKFQETDKYLSRFGTKLGTAISLSNTHALEEAPVKLPE